jgi:hypothetical protein
MDPKLLADVVTIFLAPAMPYLVTGGKEVVRTAGKKLCPPRSGLWPAAPWRCSVIPARR